MTTYFFNLFTDGLRELKREKKGAVRENTFPLALQSIYKHIYQEICRKYKRSLKATNIKLAITRKRLRRRIRSHLSSLLTNYS